MAKEKVIVRREYDPYGKFYKYLCIFPENYEGAGRYGSVSIWKNKYGQWIAEPYTSVSRLYFYKCKIIHKNDPEIAEVLKGLDALYGPDEGYDNGCAFEVVEKIMR